MLWKRKNTTSKHVLTKTQLLRKLNALTIHWKEIPLLRLLIPFILGVYLGETYFFFLPSTTHYYYTIAISLGLLLYLSNIPMDYAQRWLSGLTIGGCLLVLGVFLSSQFDERKQLGHFSQLMGEGTTHILLGQINSYPKKTARYSRFTISVLGYTSKNLESCSGNLLVYLKNDSLHLDYGDQVLIKGKLHAIPPPSNPLSFDFQRYNHFQNVHYQTFVEAKDYQIVRKKCANWIVQSSYELRKKLQKKLQNTIDDSVAFSIVAAMTLGYKDAITEDLRTAYAETGVLHILAVSGLHVGILSEVVLLLLALLGGRGIGWKRIRWLLSLMVIWGFVFMVGSVASVVRAAIMFSFLNFGRIFRRNIHPLNSLAAAAILLLIANPHNLFQVGFQFSFLAVAGIILLYKPLLQLWTFDNWFLQACWKLTAVGISAQLFVCPLSIYYFHQLPVYFWLTGLLVVPMATIILYTGISLLIISFVHSNLAVLIGTFLGMAIGLQNQFIYAIQQLPFALLDRLWVQSYEVFALYISIACLLLFVYKRNTKYALAALIILLLCSIHSLYREYKIANRYQLVVYDLPKKSLIDFIMGNEIYTLQAHSITTKEIGFAVENYRIAQANSVQKIDTSIELPHLWIEGQYIQFGDKRLIIVDRDSLPLSSKKHPIRCDYLVVRNNPSINLAVLQKSYDFELLIFDSSNRRKRLQQWEKECSQLGIPYYNVRKSGAYLSVFFD